MQLRLKREILIVTLLFAVTVFTAAIPIYIFENVKNPQVESYGDALWLAAITATSVGYGDVYPVSSVGKLVTSILGFVGLMLIGATSALFTAYVFGKGGRK